MKIMDKMTPMIKRVMINRSPRPKIVLIRLVKPGNNLPSESKTNNLNNPRAPTRSMKEGKVMKLMILNNRNNLGLSYNGWRMKTVT